RWSKTYMTEDQRFASRRTDVLVYQSEPLEEDLTIAGPIRATLHVSTSATAADWIVKVIDVFPGEIADDAPIRNPNPPPASRNPRRRPSDPRGGYQMLIRGEAFRGRFRNSYEKPEPFVSDQVTEVSFQLWDVMHTFRRGHRIMIHVQSTWFPLIDRNPQTYVPNIFEADWDDFVPATHRVHRTSQHPSHLEFGVIADPTRTAIETPPPRQ
ncbi:MAG: CocE/NonD family hydrolase, partial [Myxococcota bacterium]